MSSEATVSQGQVSADSNSQPGKFKLLTVDQLLALPEPDWLVDGMIAEDAFCILYGPSGSGKSFVAIDWALSVATGRDWLGKQIKKGVAIYVVAEGTQGVGKRVRAWMKHYGVDAVPGAFFILEAPQLHREEDRKELITAIAAHKPSLVVFDTFAQCFVGGDENSVSDVGVWIDGARQLRRNSKITVLIVHHTGKANQGVERGSSALRAAADSMFLVNKTGKRVTLKNDKQKDDEQAPKMTLEFTPVDPPASADGKSSSSCVLTLTAAGSVAGETGDGLNERQSLALKVLVDLGEAKSGDWRQAVGDRLGREVSENTFPKWRSALKEKGYVEGVPGKPYHYRPTLTGVAHATGTVEEAA